MKQGTVQIGLVGCGVVGQGLVKILERNLAEAEAKAGARLRLVWVAAKRKKDLPVIGGVRPRFTTKWRDVVADPAVDIVVELIGGTDPARSVVLEALKNRKQVATANKALLASHWNEVFGAAQSAHSLLYFEAAVGGGIPVIQGLNEGLAANRIERICGIMNGTTNYILTRMSEEKLSFREALAAARHAGFAEANPAFDVGGIDAANKIAILGSLSMGGWVKVDDVYREGIAGLDVWDVTFARERLGLVTKLLAFVDIQGNRFRARVHPTLIPSSHPFTNVRHEYNAFFIHGDAVGDVMFYGRGAGQMATASAVASDVIYLARQVANGTAGQVPYVVQDPARTLKKLSMDDLMGRHYLRFTAADRPGVLTQITQILSARGISISSVHQADSVLAERDVVKKAVPVVIVTHRAADGAVRDAARAAGRLAVMAKPPVHLRIDPLNRSS